MVGAVDLGAALADKRLAQSESPLLSSPRYFYQRRDADRATIRQRLADALQSSEPVQSADWENYMRTFSRLPRSILSYNGAGDRRWPSPWTSGGSWGS